MDVLECAYMEAIKLSALSSKIELAGSIRRLKPSPNDVDIVLIPKSGADKASIINYAKSHPAGNIGLGGGHASYKIHGIEVEIYFTSEENWGSMLMFATGSQRYNVWLRKLAKFRKMKLSQYGLFERDSNKRIAGETEESIYEALGKKWKPPERRGIFRG